MNEQIKIGTPSITTPNYLGEIVRETPTMWIVKLLKRTFEPKSSISLTHKFTKARQKWFNDGFVPSEKKFFKKNGKEVGGDRFIVNHKLLLQ